MDTMYYQRMIVNCQKNISSANNDIDLMELKLDRLRQCKMDFDKSVSSILEKLECERITLGKIKGITDVKLAVSYSEEMGKLLDGADADSAKSSMDSISKILKEEIVMIEDSIRQKQNEITSLTRLLGSYQYQMDFSIKEGI